MNISKFYCNLKHFLAWRNNEKKFLCSFKHCNEMNFAFFAYFVIYVITFRNDLTTFSFYQTFWCRTKFDFMLVVRMSTIDIFTKFRCVKICNYFTKNSELAITTFHMITKNWFICKFFNFNLKVIEWKFCKILKTLKINNRDINVSIFIIDSFWKCSNFRANNCFETRAFNYWKCFEKFIFLIVVISSLWFDKSWKIKIEQNVYIFFFKIRMRSFFCFVYFFFLTTKIFYCYICSFKTFFKQIENFWIQNDMFCIVKLNEIIDQIRCFFQKKKSIYCQK